MQSELRAISLKPLWGGSGQKHPTASHHAGVCCVQANRRWANCKEVGTNSSQHAGGRRHSETKVLTRISLSHSGFDPRIQAEFAKHSTHSTHSTGHTAQKNTAHTAARLERPAHNTHSTHSTHSTHPFMISTHRTHNTHSTHSTHHFMMGGGGRWVAGGGPMIHRGGIDPPQLVTRRAGTMRGVRSMKLTSGTAAAAPSSHPAVALWRHSQFLAAPHAQSFGTAVAGMIPSPAAS